MSTQPTGVGLWLITVANARKHGTTGVPPEHRLQQELAALLPLPQVGRTIFKLTPGRPSVDEMIARIVPLLDASYVE